MICVWGKPWIDLREFASRGSAAYLDVALNVCMLHIHTGRELHGDGLSALGLCTSPHSQKRR